MRTGSPCLREFVVDGIVAVTAANDMVFAERRREMILMTQVAAHVPRTRLGHEDGQLKLGKNLGVRLSNLLVRFERGWQRRIKCVEILHEKFATAQEAVPRAEFISIFTGCETRNG